MQNIIIKNEKGNIVSAEFILSFYSDETKKNYIVLNNSELVFTKESTYNNLEVFEITKEDDDVFYISDILDEEWEIIQNLMIKEIFSKIL